MHREGEADWSNNLPAEEISENRRTPFLSNVGSLLAETGAILSLLPPLPARVLDAGCACGRLTHFIQMQGYDATGVDVCGDEIRWAQNHHAEWRGRQSRPQFRVSDFDNLMNNNYDAVVFAGALHHSMNRVVTLRSAFRALKPGGIVIACEPGLGHGWTKVSREWARRMNVTERSCPPVAVAWAGYKAGFRNVKVYPNPVTIFCAAYARGGHVRENGFMKMFRKIPVPVSALVLTSLKWLHGITVMQKPKE